MLQSGEVFGFISSDFQVFQFQRINNYRHSLTNDPNNFPTNPQKRTAAAAAFRLSTLRTCRLILSDFNSIIRRFPFVQQPSSYYFEKYKFPSILVVSKHCIGLRCKPTSSVSPIIVFEIEPLRHFFTVTFPEPVHFYPVVLFFFVLLYIDNHTIDFLQS